MSIDARQGRGAGKESLPKQMVVILNPELEVFHTISDKLDKVNLLHGFHLVSPNSYLLKKNLLVFVFQYL